MSYVKISPSCLMACTNALLQALSEARDLVLQGATGSSLRDKLGFAQDQMEIIARAVDASAYDRSACEAVAYLSEQIRSLEALIRPIERPI